DQLHHTYRARLVGADPERAFIERTQIKERPSCLEAQQRAIVLESVQEVCLQRSWILYAAHVRSTHVHVVADGDLRPEAMMNAFKAYASRALNRGGIEAGRRTRWARHGSTRWLWSKDHIRSAVQYVIEGQGEPMAVF